jgi:hypothetical protein
VRVTLEEHEEHLIAVLEFSGSLSNEKINVKSSELLSYLERDGLNQLAGVPVWRISSYNPPWTLPWLKKHEIWVSLAGVSEADVVQKLTTASA